MEFLLRLQSLTPFFRLRLPAGRLTLILILMLSSAYSQNARQWATYIGGSFFDEAKSVATDNAGNVYIAGTTNSTSNIWYDGFQQTYGGGNYDALLVKFDSAGNRIWATYYGGIGDEDWCTVATDDSGNVFLAGSTSSAAGIAFNGFQNTKGLLRDAFLVKFDTDGNRIWGTYYGSDGNEDGLTVCVDNSNNVYLSGMTNSGTGIASGGFQNTYGGWYDAFIVKFDQSGNRIWASYFGGPGVEYGAYYSATDVNDNIYITGVTTSQSNIGYNGFDNVYGGGWDAYLAKVDSAGNRIWSTYYGGSADNYGTTVAADLNGNVFLAGFTESDSLIPYNGFQNSFGGGLEDNFIVKFDSLGSRIWASYYGGEEQEDCYSMVCDPLGDVYLTGFTKSGWGISHAGFSIGYSGAVDAFLAKFYSNGGLYCATYYGGQGADRGFSVTLDNWGNVYMAGRSYSSAGIAFNGFQNSYSGGNDAFLVKFSPCLNVSTEELSPEDFSIYPNPSSGQLTINSAGSLQGIRIVNMLGETVYYSDEKIEGESNLDVSFLPAGFYSVILNNNGTSKTARFSVIR